MEDLLASLELTPGCHRSLRLLVCVAILVGLNRPASLTAQTAEEQTTLLKINSLLQAKNFPEAIAVGERALRSMKQTNTIPDSFRIEITESLALAYLGNGDMAAQVHILETEAQDLEAHGSKEIGIAQMYQMAASSSGELGRNLDAERDASRAVQLFELRLSPDDLRIANALYTLSLQERVLGNREETIHALRKALTISSTATPSYMSLQTRRTVLLGLASFYDDSDPGRAGEYRKQALAISTDPLGTGGLPDNFTNAGDTGMAALKAGNFTKAEQAFEEQLAIVKRLVGDDSEDATFQRSLLAQAYLGNRDQEKARPLVLRILETVSHDYQHDFALMNEDERLEFAQSAESRLGLFCSYVHQFHDLDPESVGTMYELALWSKGAVLATVESVQRRLRSSNNPELVTLRRALEEKTSDYRRAQTTGVGPAYQLKASIDLLQNQILAKLGLGSAEPLTWKDIQRQLGPADVSIEIIRFRYTDGRPASAFYYAALVLRKGWIAPQYVFLGSEDEIQGSDIPSYLLYATAKLGPPKAPSLQFWNRLEDSLGENAKTLYISPDGALTNVSFAIIADRQQNLLIDRFNLYTLASTRDLLPRRSSPPRTNFAVLVGSLPDTGAQVDAIATLLQRFKWDVEELTGSRATKAGVVSTAKRPRILHFATHGFFSTQSSSLGPMLAFRTEAAMFESGLVMAGANVTGDDSQSAYLTADEISSFDLSGTELVFLSACDTGLVDTPTGAEVYGLRRAFQLAGAESVIMTMWRIQPAQASEIVEKFYQAWLSGVDKHSALILAQQKVRQNNPAPYYWGAFVMIGH